MNFDITGKPSRALQHGKCILCHKHQQLAKSHVVSDFVQQRLMGEVTPGTTKHLLKFSTGGRTWPLSQKLPQFPLMCADCDSEMGSKIEGPGAMALLGAWSVTNPCEFSGNVRLRSREVKRDAGASLWAYEVWPDDLALQKALDKFAILTAWRAMHAELILGTTPVTEFLATNEGANLDAVTRKMLQGHTVSARENPNRASLLALPVSTLFELTGSKSLPTLCTGFATLGEANAIVVRFGLWQVVWPLNYQASEMLYELEEELLRAWVTGSPNLIVSAP